MEDRQANGHPGTITPGSARDHLGSRHGTSHSHSYGHSLSLLSLVRPPKRGLVGLEGGVGHLETTILVILV